MITIIDHIMTDAVLSPGRYILDTECRQSDIHRLVRPLRDGECEYTAWCHERSDTARVVEITATDARVLV